MIDIYDITALLVIASIFSIGVLGRLLYVVLTVDNMGKGMMPLLLPSGLQGMRPEAKKEEVDSEASPGQYI